MMQEQLPVEMPVGAGFHSMPSHSVPPWSQEGLGPPSHGGGGGEHLEGRLHGTGTGAHRSMAVNEGVDVKEGMGVGASGRMAMVEEWRKRRAEEEALMLNSGERKQQRMIKNRESAARSRARKQVGMRSTRPMFEYCCYC